MVATRHRDGFLCEGGGVVDRRSPRGRLASVAILLEHPAVVVISGGVSRIDPQRDPRALGPQDSAPPRRAMQMAPTLARVSSIGGQAPRLQSGRIRTQRAPTSTSLGTPSLVMRRGGAGFCGLGPQGSLDPSGVVGLSWAVRPSRSQEAVHILQQPHGPVLLLEASPCGTKVATAECMRTYVWSAMSGELELELPRSPQWAQGLAITWDGARVVSSATEMASIWDGVTGKLLRRRVCPGVCGRVAGSAPGAPCSWVVPGGLLGVCACRASFSRADAVYTWLLDA